MKNAAWFLSGGLVVLLAVGWALDRQSLGRQLESVRQELAAEVGNRSDADRRAAETDQELRQAIEKTDFRLGMTRKTVNYLSQAEGKRSFAESNWMPLPESGTDELRAMPEDERQRILDNEAPWGGPDPRTLSEQVHEVLRENTARPKGDR